MSNSTTPQKNPYKVKVEKGKTYFWCSCGPSQKQPFCDGSHKKDGEFKSVKYLPDESKEAFFVDVKCLKIHLFVMGHILGFNIF